jgi:hypothetical protein
MDRVKTAKIVYLVFYKIPPPGDINGRLGWQKIYDFQPDTPPFCLVSVIEIHDRMGRGAIRGAGQEKILRLGCETPVLPTRQTPVDVKPRL